MQCEVLVHGASGLLTQCPNVAAHVLDVSRLSGAAPGPVSSALKTGRTVRFCAHHAATRTRVQHTPAKLLVDTNREFMRTLPLSDPLDRESMHTLPLSDPLDRKFMQTLSLPDSLANKTSNPTPTSSPSTSSSSSPIVSQVIIHTNVGEATASLSGLDCTEAPRDIDTVTLKVGETTDRTCERKPCLTLQDSKYDGIKSPASPSLSSKSSLQSPLTDFSLTRLTPFPSSPPPPSPSLHSTLSPNRITSSISASLRVVKEDVTRHHDSHRSHEVIPSLGEVISSLGQEVRSFRKRESHVAWRWERIARRLCQREVARLDRDRESVASHAVGYDALRLEVNLLRDEVKHLKELLLEAALRPLYVST
jgi:hypothetical protein